MKLSDYINTYYEFSGKASDVARNLAFAGIAFVWIFKVDAKPAPRIPRELLIPTLLLALTLACDLLQYISATCVWGVFQWYYDRKFQDVSEDPILDASSILKLPQLLFFILKLFTVLLAYIFIMKYAWCIWFRPESF